MYNEIDCLIIKFMKGKKFLIKNYFKWLLSFFKLILRLIIIFLFFCEFMEWKILLEILKLI